MDSLDNFILSGRRTGLALFLFLSIPLVGAICFGQERQSSGAVEEIEAVFDIGIIYQPIPGEYGITELMNAALAGNTSKVEALILAGADVNAVDDGGATALTRAAAYEHIDVVKQLLAANADPDPVSDDGRSALSVAVEYQSSAVALALLRHGANPNAYLNANRPEWRRSVLPYRPRICHRRWGRRTAKWQARSWNT